MSKCKSMMDSCICFSHDKDGNHICECGTVWGSSGIVRYPGGFDNAYDALMWATGNNEH